MPVTGMLLGGLGNQMFVVATGYGLAKRLGTNFYIVKEEFAGCLQGNHPRKYYDTIFSAVEKYTYIKDGKKITYNACTIAKEMASKLTTPSEKEANKKIRRSLDCGFLNWLI